MKLKLREIRTQPAMQRGQTGILLTDPLHLSDKAFFIPDSLAGLLILMDGTRDIGTLRTGFELRTGIPLNGSLLEQLISQLDEAFFLDNERYAQAYEIALRDYRAGISRPPILAGKCYPSDSGELTAFLKQYFDQAENDSIEHPGKAGEVRGLICPHIDFERGAHIYAKVWAQAKAAVRQAELVVILGTDHNEATGKITLTRQNYETPWGIIPTAKEIVQELVDEIGDDALLCELHHRGEHSIEAAAIWLHYLLGDEPCDSLPILCGSFQPFIEQCQSPRKATHIESTIEVLKRVSNRYRTLIVAAADLAHMGPVFGDPFALDMVGRARMAEQDEELMAVIDRGNAEDFFAMISAERDRRHICGVPPIYIALSILDGIEGTTLGYAQCPASDDGTSSVSICGTIF